jgi:uncharacterized membrane protein YccC
VLTGCFPQQRAPFLIGLAFWGAASAFVATLFRNFAAYASALAGYTAAIVASDQLGATGGPTVRRAPAHRGPRDVQRQYEPTNRSPRLDRPLP